MVLNQHAMLLYAMLSILPYPCGNFLNVIPPQHWLRFLCEMCYSMCQDLDNDALWQTDLPTVATTTPTATRTPPATTGQLSTPWKWQPITTPADDRTRHPAIDSTHQRIPIDSQPDDGKALK